MKLSWRTGIALVIGGIALGSTLSTFAQDASPNASPDDEDKVMLARPGPGPGPGHHFVGHGLVTSETTVEGEEEGSFDTIRADAGTLKAIDGSTLLIERSDGETVEVATSDDTDIRREREEAEVSDLVVGDHVVTHRVKEGDAAFLTKHVMAISATKYAEFEANREACTDDDASTTCEHPKRGFHHRHGPQRDGDVAEAPEPAMFEMSADAA